MSLGQLIRARREALGMTLEELGEAAGIAKSHVFALEADTTPNPGLRTCTHIAVALGISVQSMAAALLRTKTKSTGADHAK